MSDNNNQQTENHIENHTENHNNTNNNTNNNINTALLITMLDTNITNVTLDQTITQPGFQVHNIQGTNNNADEVTSTTFITTDQDNHIPNITENLVEVVTSMYDDEVGSHNIILDEIKLYASKIQCSDFHGKGTIDDYSELFTAAAKIANESKQMQLDVDIEGFESFGTAADELSAIFSSFTLKLQNVSIIDDTIFLTAVVNALRKIWNLSEVFGRFKETILATTSIALPKSAHDTSVILSGVMSEVSCAMNYINYFVSPDDTTLVDTKLSSEDKNIITNAVTTINNWNILCDNGVSIAMSNNPDIQYINQTNNNLRVKTNLIKTATILLKKKLAQYNLIS